MTARTAMALDLGLKASAPTKTFVLEVHSTEPVAYLEDLVGRHNVEATADAYLFRARTDAATFWVDQLDERFWSFHTDSSIRDAHSFLRKNVEARRDLDWVWLPSEHLRKVWPGSVTRRIQTEFHGADFLPEGTATARDLSVRLTGKDADRLLSYLKQNQDYRSAVSFSSTQTTIIDPDHGALAEGIDRMGRFAVYGNSMEFHTQVVRAVVSRYRNLVEMCEKKALGWGGLELGEVPDGGGRLTGHPLALRFSRPVDDVGNFATQLFSSRQPFRLWGEPRIDDGVAQIEAVDLHIGHRILFEIGTTWMRIYLYRGGCGNSVARLVSNLQHTFDSEVSFVDPELHEALVRPGAVDQAVGSPNAIV